MRFALDGGLTGLREWANQKGGFWLFRAMQSKLGCWPPRQYCVKSYEFAMT